MFRKVLLHTKRSIKFIILFAIATFLIIGAIALLYKPTYSVYISGEQVGYTSNKSELQQRINTYIEGENLSDENLAFIQVNNLPSYKLCLLKRNIVTNDDEIFSLIESQGIPYYKFYAILENEEEKIYVSSFETANEIVNQLKEKESTNKDNLTIIEKYETETKEFTSTEDAISTLYKEAPKVIVATTRSSTSSKYSTTGSVNTSTTTSSSKPDLGITLIKPISGTISSKFGSVSSIRSSAHTGLDIAASKGTPIAAAASGTVTFSGTKGSYGNMIVISHENGVQTYYAHCNTLSVTAGTYVSQGQTIATVGSTGNSTGPHLHLEIRVNGVAYNPQYYVY